MSDKARLVSARIGACLAIFVIAAPLIASAGIAGTTCESLFISTSAKTAKFKANYGINYLPTATIAEALPPSVTRAFAEAAVKSDLSFRRYLSRHQYGSVDEARVGAQAILADPNVPIVVNGILNHRVTTNLLRASFAEQLQQQTGAPVEVRYIPAIKGRGVFATALIRKGSLIGEYAGVIRVMHMQKDRANMYLMMTSFEFRKIPVIVDGETSGNFGRFLNHSSLPVTAPNGSNALFSELFLDGRPRFAIFATRDIQPGEQVLINYGDDYWTGLGVDPALFK